LRIFQSSWQDRNGIKLHLQAWEPDGRPKAVVGLLHGLGEHIARYAAMAQALVKANYAVVGFDLRGHGRSGGRRGHTPSFEALLDEIDDLRDRIKERHPGRPVFLYGHSLGGELALVYALKRKPKIRGVIATGPWLRAVVPAPPLKVAVARALNPILPIYTERWAQLAEDLSRDPGVRSEFEHDPLVHNLITARMYLESRDAGLWAIEHAAEFPLPLLLMHGTADKLTSWEASGEFARRLGKRCTWKSWEGWYHELHNEPAASKVNQTAMRWMDRQLAAAGQMRPGMRKSRSLRRKGV
jgi:alpha-beta hydrolase superfamily lysophospholipase